MEKLETLYSCYFRHFDCIGEVYYDQHYILHTYGGSSEVGQKKTKHSKSKHFKVITVLFMFSGNTSENQTLCGKVSLKKNLLHVRLIAIIYFSVSIFL